MFSVNHDHLSPFTVEIDCCQEPAARVPGAGGDVGKVDWEKAASRTINRSTSGYPVEDAPVVRLDHDGTHLYIELDDPTPPRRLQRRGFFAGDHWELFFSADRKRPYRQMGIRPGGSWQSLSHGEPTPWKAPAEVVQLKGDDRWVIRVALPLKELDHGGRVAPGTALYMNIFRGQTRGEPPLALSPTFSKSFHVIERLAELQLK